MNAITPNRYAVFATLIALFRSMALVLVALVKGLISTLVKVAFGAGVLMAIVIAKLLPAAVALALVRRLC